MSRGNRKLSKQERREQRRQRRFEKQQQRTNPQPIPEHDREFQPKRDLKPLSAKTESQGHYILAIQEAALTFGIGPAGTGKTYVCGSLAAEALLNDHVEKIVLTRPAVEAGESLGFLPGEIDEKFEPYLQPFRDVLNERLGRGHVEYLIKMGRIECVPLAYMRGRTFKDSFVILDEAQNASVTQMKMFLTRIGENCKVIVNGDPAQTDIREASGLMDAVRRLEDLRDVRSVEFCKKDVVRSGLVQMIVERYQD